MSEAGKIKSTLVAVSTYNLTKGILNIHGELYIGCNRASPYGASPKFLKLAIKIRVYRTILPSLKAARDKRLVSESQIPAMCEVYKLLQL